MVIYESSHLFLPFSPLLGAHFRQKKVGPRRKKKKKRFIALLHPVYSNNRPFSSFPQVSNGRKEATIFPNRNAFPNTLIRSNKPLSQYFNLRAFRA